MTKTRLFIGILLVCALIVSMSACMQKGQKLPITEEKTVNIEEFLATKPKPKEIFEFIVANLNSLTKEGTDSLILELESAQNDLLTTISKDFFKEDVQKALSTGSTDSISELLKSAEENGFKIESAEGMYYPIIDYAKYKGWSNKASEDLKSYISIMAKQSDKPTAKDAALVITWDELARRAVEMERFVEKYPASARFNDIKEKYEYYKTFVFFGLNNTPLFSYDTKVMRNDALLGYKKFLEEGTDSNLAKSLKQFVELAEKNNLKLTKEVEDFRESFR
ncbi:MAG: hypothetical protein BWY15_00946 [Firmicutes bacterium ADurb.Bin193]|nr:MAG: hypothetical protein BWY15_00946 [Firmicutes bacterium ADurb.Bin193]